MKKLIAIALCALTIGSAAVVAPAVSPDTSSPFSITANAAVPERNMYIGQRSETVKWLQWTLTALGYDTKGCDGVYGSNTKAAVYRYQNPGSWSSNNKNNNMTIIDLKNTLFLLTSFAVTFTSKLGTYITYL